MVRYAIVVRLTHRTQELVQFKNLGVVYMHANEIKRCVIKRANPSRWLPAGNLQLAHAERSCIPTASAACYRAHTRAISVRACELNVVSGWNLRNWAIATLWESL